MRKKDLPYDDSGYEGTTKRKGEDDPKVPKEIFLLGEGDDDGKIRKSQADVHPIEQILTSLRS